MTLRTKKPPIPDTPPPPPERAIINYATILVRSAITKINRHQSPLDDLLLAEKLLTNDLGYHGEANRPCIVMERNKRVATVFDLVDGEERKIGLGELVVKG